MRALLPLLLLAALGAGAWLLWSGAGSPGGGALSSAVAEAEQLHAANDHARSEVAYARAAQLALAAGDELNHFAYRAQRGVCLKMLGRTDEARQELLPALAFARERGVPRIEGLALGNLVRVEGLDGNTEGQMAWYDQLVAFAEDQDDPRLEVQTLEQVGTLALLLGDLEGALARLDRALELDPQLSAADSRKDALLRQKAATLAILRDDEGAWATWELAAPAAAGRAKQASHLAALGLHEAAAEAALDAARQFEAEGAGRLDERDRALRLHVDQLLAAGRGDEAAGMLEQLIAAASEPSLMAPLRTLQARLLLSRDQPEAAAAALQDARALLQGSAADEAGWLAVVALVKSARPDDALALLDGLPDCLAASLLRAWIYAVRPPDSSLALEAVPGLDPTRDHSADSSLRRLRTLSPEALPSLAWLCLHLALADAGKLRQSGRTGLADSAVRDAIVRALRWQTLEAAERVLERWPPVDRVAPAFDRAQRWVAGELAADEAVVAVLPGRELSYLVLCTSDLGGTTFGIAAATILRDRVGDVVKTLRSGTVQAVAGASHRLYTTLFDERALADLAGRRSWTCVFPDLLTPVPPAMLVAAEPTADQPVAWLVRDHLVRLLPCAALVAPAAGVHSWHQLGQPAIDVSAAKLAFDQLARRYGASALAGVSLRPRQAELPAVVGPDATAGALQRLLAEPVVAEVCVPALGGGRLAGLILAPWADAPFGDERVGFVPWHRLAQWNLRASLVLDSARIDPGDAGHGAAYVAMAAMLGGAPELLLTRWPLPPAVRVGMLEQLDQSLPDGAQLDLAERLAATQRIYLSGAEASGDPKLVHPRLWAAWLPFGAKD